MQTSTTSVDPELAMDSDSPADQQPTQILKPRNRGESLKIAETVLRKRNRDIKGLAQRAQKRIDLRKVCRSIISLFHYFISLELRDSHFLATGCAPSKFRSRRRDS